VYPGVWGDQLDQHLSADITKQVCHNTDHFHTAPGLPKAATCDFRLPPEVDEICALLEY